MKTKLLNTAVALALAALAGSAWAQAQPPLRISFTADIRSTEPGVNRDSNSDAVVPVSYTHLTLPTILLV